MQVWTAYLALALTFVSKAMASGDAHGAHHASITDLLAPAVNVAIILAFMVWKLKKPLSEMFTKKAEEVVSTIERASIKSKEAQVRLEAQQKKMNNIEKEISDIDAQNENDLKAFEKSLAHEVEEKTRKLKTDANLKIEANKKAMLEELNSEILDKVISQTKSTITTNKDFQNKASNKLLQGLN